MTEHARNVVLLVAGIAFIVFILFKRGLPASGRTPEAREARKRIAEARARASDPSAGREARAAALREAAAIALESLQHPGMAAAYARRAERLDPANLEGVALVSHSLRRASRFRALERMLWRRLGSTDAAALSPSAQASLDELIALYAGPLKRPEIAAGLRRIQLGSKMNEAG